MTISVGLIGNWGHHVDVLADVDAAKDILISGISPGFPEEDIEALARRYMDTAIISKDPVQMLETVQPDIAVISTRLDRISPLAMLAAKQGCHLICEKPLALNQSDLHNLWQSLMSHKVECIPMLTNRFHPVFSAASTCIQSGKIGNVYLLNIRKSYKNPDLSSGWLDDRGTYGGTIPWVGIHALDFLDAISKSRFHSVCAQHANVAHPSQKNREDLCTMMIRMQNGIQATCSLDYLRPLAMATHGDDWIRVVGDKGVLEIALDENELTLINEEGKSFIRPFSNHLHYYSDWIRSVAQKKNTEPNDETHRGFRLCQAALCARDAADESIQKIILPGPWDI
jgi:predicted dehydrogenase